MLCVLCCVCACCVCVVCVLCMHQLRMHISMYCVCMHECFVFWFVSGV